MKDVTVLFQDHTESCFVTENGVTLPEAHDTVGFFAIKLPTGAEVYINPAFVVQVRIENHE